MTQIRRSRPGYRALRKRLQAPLIATALALAVLLGTRTAVPDPFLRLQNYAFDSAQRAAPRADADKVAPGTGVVVVDIDEASLARYGQWPWRRSLVAELIDRLRDAGAVAIGLDIVFAEPDRTSPAALAPRWAKDHGLVVTRRGRSPDAVDGASLPDYDHDLAVAIGHGRVVTGYSLLPDGNGLAPDIANSVAVIGGGPPPDLTGFSGAVPNLHVFDEAAAGQGSFTVAGIEHDEVVRRLPLFAALGGAPVPSLAAETLRVAAGEDAELALREEHAGGALLGATGYSARIGDRIVPIDSSGAMWIHFGERDPGRTLSAARVLDPAGAATLRTAVANRIVLVGTSAVGLSDLRPTPLASFTPGVNIHAAAIEQISAGDSLDRPFWAHGAETKLAVLFGLGVALVVGLAGARAGAITVFVGAGSAIGGAAFGFARHDLLLDPSLVVLSGGFCFMAAFGARYFAGERRARQLRTAFGQYLSPQLVEALARDPERMQLGGEEREMTFLFTDLEGFTSFTESVTPALLVSTLNNYLDGVCAIAMDHGGTIDKIVGDAVHVMFNAPLDQSDHATRAVRCALAIDLFSQAFATDASRLAAAGRSFGTTRIGINTGRAVVGNFGGSRRFDYTAHGDAINTAARLEAANKRLGTRICVSLATVEAVGDQSGLAFRPIGALELKGKAIRVDVFSPTTAEAPESRWADRYGDAFARLSRGEADGPDAILALLTQYPEDPLLRFHAERIGRGLRGTGVPLQAA